MERSVRRWRLGGKVDAFEIESGPEAGVLHCHPTFNIGAMISGAASVEVGANRHEQAPGCVVTLNAYQAHASSWSAARNVYFVLHIDTAFWQDVWDDAGLGPDCGFSAPLSQDPILFYFLMGLREQLQRDPDKVGLADVGLLLMLCRVRGQVYVGQSQPALPDPAAELRGILLEENEDDMQGAHRIGSLAEQVGLTRFQFSRLCQRSAGMQPRRLRLQLMVARAQQAINDGQSLAAASATAGFSDQSHMNREFRRTIGMTPREHQRVTH